MCDAAAVELAGIARVSPHAVAVLARGDVGSARAAAEAGAAAAGGRARAVRVIPAPGLEASTLVDLHAHHRPPGRISRRVAEPTAPEAGPHGPGHEPSAGEADATTRPRSTKSAREKEA
jgi:microcompartment protein CcmL/EutN